MHIIFQDVAIQESQMDLTQLEFFAFSMLKQYTDYKLYTCRLVGCLLKLQLRVIPDSSDNPNSISLASKVNDITTMKFPKKITALFQ